MRILSRNIDNISMQNHAEAWDHDTGVSPIDVILYIFGQPPGVAHLSLNEGKVAIFYDERDINMKNIMAYADQLDECNWKEVVHQFDTGLQTIEINNKYEEFVDGKRDFNTMVDDLYNEPDEHSL